jgi:hypothetical protein
VRNVYLTREALEETVRTVGPDGDGSRTLILETDAALRAEVERLSVAEGEAMLVVESQGLRLTRYRKAIENAPHAEACDAIRWESDLKESGKPCDCWKAAALAGEEEKE